LEGAKTVSECCKECTKKIGCTSFHIGKLHKDKSGKGDCFLFSHTAIVPVKSLGGECYQLIKGKGKSNDNDEDGPTEEQCKKFLNKACPGQLEKKDVPPQHKTTDEGKSKQPKEHLDTKSKKKTTVSDVQNVGEEDKAKPKPISDKKEAKKDDKLVSKEVPIPKTSDSGKKQDDKKQDKDKKKTEVEKEHKKPKSTQKYLCIVPINLYWKV
jgi:hypothetical protein